MIPDLRFPNGGARLRRAPLPLLITASCLLSPALHAATEIQYYITITNTPAGLTSNLTVNIGTASTRYWTNNAAGAPGTSIQITNSTAASATNLLTHLTAYPVFSVGSGTPQLAVGTVSSNLSTLVLTAPLDTNLTVTLGGLWARGHYVTNTYADSYPILSPTNAMSARVRTNSVNAIVNLLAATNMVASNSIPPGAYFARHYTDNTTAQSVSNKTLLGPVLSGGRFNDITNGTGTNVAFTNVVLKLAAIHSVTEINGLLGTLTNGVIWSNLLHHANISNAIAVGGVAHRLTNGYWTNAVLGSPKTTNLINYGNAISSSYGATSGEQFGANAVASGINATAIGRAAQATNAESAAFGYSALAGASAATAVGYAATAVGGNSTAVGYSTTVNSNSAGAFGAANTVNGDRSYAFGYNNTITHSNSVIIGNQSSSTANNQVLVGSSGQTINFAGIVSGAQLTNSTFIGPNEWQGDIATPPVTFTSAAAGNNTINATNRIARFTGTPGGAWTIVGITSGRDGRLFTVYNDTGYALTIANESGVDPTAANRIRTMAGTDYVSGTNGVLQFFYDGTRSRWIMISANP